MGERQYDKMLRNAMATFYLPDYITPEDITKRIEKGSFDEEIKSMPFPCIRIVRKESLTDEWVGNWMLADVVCDRDADGSFGWTSKDTLLNINGKRATFYSPEDIPINNKSIPRCYVDLIRSLQDRKNAYLEKSVSRPQRRTMGVNSDYREYIVVARKDNKNNSNLLRLSDIFRRHPQLHAVRGHLRHCVSGKVTFVKPHTRGQGELVQPKDYVIK